MITRVYAISNGETFSDFGAAKDRELELVGNRIGEILDTSIGGNGLSDNPIKQKMQVVDIMVENAVALSALLRQVAEIQETYEDTID